MAAYKNDYKKNEDEMLWELHEIRQKIRKDYKKKPLKQINEEALEIYNSWKKKREKPAKAG